MVHGTCKEGGRKRRVGEEEGIVSEGGRGGGGGKKEWRGNLFAPQYVITLSLPLPRRPRPILPDTSAMRVVLSPELVRYCTCTCTDSTETELTCLSGERRLCLCITFKDSAYPAELPRWLSW